MAELTITITNRINCFATPTDNWAAWNWNAFKWGDGTADLQATIHKYIANSVAGAAAISTGLDWYRTISNTLTVTGDTSSERLEDGSGYSYVFPDRTTDGESRDFVTWTDGAAASATWTSGTAASTTWSDA